jgi:hypothetical protein
MSLVAGQKYALEMDYYQNQGGAVASLSWSSPSTPMQIIPSTQLYPPLDIPPAVSLTAPPSGGSATAPTNLLLQASASSSDGLVAGVKFFAGTNLIGSAATAPYQVSWPNPVPGQYQLSAVAADTLGGTNQSTIASFTILPPNLTSAFATNGLVLSWPSVSGSLLLQSTTNLTPPAVWSDAGLPFVTNGNQTTVILTNLASLPGALFLRLTPR